MEWVLNLFSTQHYGGIIVNGRKASKIGKRMERQTQNSIQNFSKENTIQNFL